MLIDLDQCVEVITLIPHTRYFHSDFLSTHTNTSSNHLVQFRNMFYGERVSKFACAYYSVWFLIQKFYLYTKIDSKLDTLNKRVVAFGLMWLQEGGLPKDYVY
jgi:hypothetical protein